MTTATLDRPTGVIGVEHGSGGESSVGVEFDGSADQITPEIAQAMITAIYYDMADFIRPAFIRCLHGFKIDIATGELQLCIDTDAVDPVVLELIDDSCQRVLARHAVAALVH